MVGFTNGMRVIAVGEMIIGTSKPECCKEIYWFARNQEQLDVVICLEVCANKDLNVFPPEKWGCSDTIYASWSIKGPIHQQQIGVL